MPECDLLESACSLRAGRADDHTVALARVGVRRPEQWFALTSAGADARNRTPTRAPRAAARSEQRVLAVRRGCREQDLVRAGPYCDHVGVGRSCRARPSARDDTGRRVNRARRRRARAGTAWHYSNDEGIEVVVRNSAQTKTCGRAATTFSLRGEMLADAIATGVRTGAPAHARPFRCEISIVRCRRRAGSRGTARSMGASRTRSPPQPMEVTAREGVGPRSGIGPRDDMRRWPVRDPSRNTGCRRLRRQSTRRRALIADNAASLS